MLTWWEKKKKEDTFPTAQDHGIVVIYITYTFINILDKLSKFWIRVKKLCQS